MERANLHHRNGMVTINLSGLFESPMKSGRYVAVCQNLVPLVNIKIAGKWIFIPLKMVSIGIDP